MRIALNMLFVAPGLAGGRVYCEGLLKGLNVVDGDNEYVIYTRRGVRLPALDPQRFRQVEAPVAPGSTLGRTFWEYRRLPRAVRRERFDLFHGLGSLSPSSACPFVLTVHDVIYRHFPASVPLGYRLFMNAIHPRVARRADRVIVPSRYTGREVVEHLGVREERVRVVPEGPGGGFGPVTDGGRIEQTLTRYGVRRPYVISVCRGFPHKNLTGLLRAFGRLRGQGHGALQLVLVGEPYRGGQALARTAREAAPDGAVVFTGFVGHDDLCALYTAAEVFAFPSLAEGFGLPVLEAMSCGTPVVSSDAAALPEVVGGGGALADARDPEAFAAALARVLGSAALRDDLRARGAEQARRFSWEEAARRTLAVYEEARADGI
jgi:glycosyltransferase involved in cell wall biosynthesis